MAATDHDPVGAIHPYLMSVHTIILTINFMHVSGIRTSGNKSGEDINLSIRTQTVGGQNQQGGDVCYAGSC